MNYVTGFLLAVPTANKQRYLDLAHSVEGFFLKHGALRMVECWGENVPDGKVTSYPMALKLEEGETVVFSWIEWPSRDVAEAADEAMKTDPAFSGPTADMPFDGKRMMWGGFQMIVDARA